MLQHLQKIVSVADYIVAREQHEDGSFHLHCWLKLTAKVNIKRSDKFDFVEDEVVFHPNI